jgi:hypothetical protein
MHEHFSLTRVAESVNEQRRFKAPPVKQSSRRGKGVVGHKQASGFLLMDDAVLAFGQWTLQS